MMMLSLDAARKLGLDVGNDPRVAVSVPGLVCFVSERPWDDAATREAMAMVNLEGDALAIPPFSFQQPSLQTTKP